MTDKKFTDEEIIKALECCLITTTKKACIECPFNKQKLCDKDQWALEKYAIGLINRQKSEIERLKTENKIYIEANQVIGHQRDQRDKEIDELQKQIDGLDVRENKIKAEAYKEFAEKLKKDLFYKCGDINYSETCDFRKLIDNLLKEMVGEEE